MNKKKSSLGKKLSNFFIITWKKTAIALIIWIIAVFFHNMIYAFCAGVLKVEFEEPFFFLIATIGIPFYFIISIIYTIYKKK